jgi:membrane-associated protease RseP (regulator of RpoE activity)
VSRYSIDESTLLVYRSTASIQFRDSSFVLPAVKAGKLAGLVVRYDNGANSAEIIPSPVINHFLKDAAKAPYEGFPRTGMGFANTRDPQLRRYAGIKPGGGIYVTQVLKDGPAATAGLKIGDIILSIDGNPIDQDGNYVDPDYGKARTHSFGLHPALCRRRGEVRHRARRSEAGTPGDARPSRRPQLHD